MNNPGGNGELTLHALGVGLEGPLADLRQPKLIEQLLCPLLTSALVDAVEGGAEAQFLKPIQLFVEVALIVHHTCYPLGFSGDIYIKQTISVIVSIVILL